MIFHIKKKLIIFFVGILIFFKVNNTCAKVYDTTTNTNTLKFYENQENIISGNYEKYSQHDGNNRSETNEMDRQNQQKIYQQTNLFKTIIFNTASHNDNNKNQHESLIKLINKIAKEYLSNCPPIIFYDHFIKNHDIDLLEKLFRTFPLAYYQMELNENYTIINKNLFGSNNVYKHCRSYILFLTEPIKAHSIIGPQLISRVVVISKSTQWKLQEFLLSSESLNILNLLVIGESLTLKGNGERPYILYTHELYAGALGNSKPIVLSSWFKNHLSRPHVNLFPPKFKNGFSGHRFQVMAADQPPFIFRIRSLDFQGVSRIRWEGIEYRLLHMISKQLNFSFDIHDTLLRKNVSNFVDNMILYIKDKTVNIGMSGIYITKERLLEVDMSLGHSKDCAAFVTLASKALPKYRAIMGPFEWPVWVILTLVYLGAIFPIVYSDRLTLSHLIGNWGEIENMFWYVFGMFTNAFSFTGKYSWTRSRKWSTRILIGSYWIFTIIVTSCYTGSIIAFVTLPAFHDTVDSVNDLLGLFYRVVTLDNGGWELWFRNSTHEETARLYKKMEYVATLEEGISNVTNSFIWNFAFLGSKLRLEYLIQANFTNENLSRRSALHLSSECFAYFQVGFLYPKNSVFKNKIDSIIRLAQQGGLIQKIENDVKWHMQRSSTGKLLQASSSSTLREAIEEERQLTIADTEGMFLLMGLGYLMGTIALISEIVGGIQNKCRQIIKRNSTAFAKNQSGQPLVIEVKSNRHKMIISTDNSVQDIFEEKILDFPESNSHSYINLMVDQLLNTELFNDLLPNIQETNDQISKNEQTENPENGNL